MLYYNEQQITIYYHKKFYNTNFFNHKSYNLSFFDICKLLTIFRYNNYLFYSDKIFTDLQIVMFSNFTTDISFDKIDSITRCIQYLNINLTMM